MQFDFFRKLIKPEPDETHLVARGRRIPLTVVRSPKARRYLLRLRPDGTARLTIPKRGSVAEGRRFVERHTEWLARQLEKLEAQPVKSKDWQIGTEIYFRGELVKIEAAFIDESGMARSIKFGPETVKVPPTNVDLRPNIEKHLWKLAARELPRRAMEFAAQHQLRVVRVTVRNQKSRWGSCSRRGTISLNWRLIQTPPFVADYVILHELMHLRQMNHSARFWNEVARVCPEYKTALKWLKQHAIMEPR